MIFNVIRVLTTAFLALAGGYFCVSAYEQRETSDGLAGNAFCGLFMILSLFCIWYR